jgi:hypothetical protein
MALLKTASFSSDYFISLKNLDFFILKNFQSINLKFKFGQFETLKTSFF